MTLRSLGILRAKDVPPIEVLLVECPQPNAPYGIKGVGEIGLVPTAPRRGRGAARPSTAIWRVAAAHEAQARRRQRSRRGLARWAAVTPGLVCGHHHLYSSAGPGHARHRRPARPTFLEILQQVWWRLDAALDLEMLRWSALLGAIEALMCGTTGIVDHHERPDAIEGSLSVIADACAEVGVRVVAAYGVTDRWHDEGRLQDDDWPPPKMTDAARRGLAENERFLRDGGQGHGRRPRGVHVQRRHAGRRRRAGRRPRRRRPHPRRRGHRRPRRRRPPGRRWPATTGCSCTASTSTATCPAPSPTTPAPT